MRVYAAIDLRDGAAVQLVGGDPAEERVRLPDPAAVARRWLDAGFRHLHVVDLDGALGAGPADRGGRRTAGPSAAATAAPSASAAAVAAIAARARGRATLQAGGGVRDGTAVRRLLGLGAERAVVGTRAVEDRAWLEATAARFPARLVVAADVRSGTVLRRGWRESSGLRADAFLASLAPLPLAAVLVTDVDREGRQEGIDAALFRRLATVAGHPLVAAGGISSAQDLRVLRDAGAAGAILGMALYTGRLDPATALELEDT